MMYDPPPRFGTTLQTWESERRKVEAWPDSVENKAQALEQIDQMIELSSSLNGSGPASDSKESDGLLKRALGKDG